MMSSMYVKSRSNSDSFGPWKIFSGSPFRILVVKEKAAMSGRPQGPYESELERDFTYIDDIIQ